MRRGDIIDLVGLIYASVGDPAGWPTVIDAVRDALGADAAVQTFSNASPSTVGKTRIVEPESVIGMDAADALLIAEHVPLSPLAGYAAQLGLGKVNLVYEIVPKSEFRRSYFYERCIHPAGLTDALVACLSSIGPEMATLQLMRAGGSFVIDDEHRVAADTVMGHLAKAFSINRDLVGLGIDRASVFSDLVGRLAAGVVLVDADGMCLWANASAERMLANSDGLAIDAGRIVSPVIAAMRPRWRSLLLTLAGKVPGVAAIERPSGRLPLSAVALPTNEQDRQKVIGYFRASRAIGTIILHDHHVADYKAGEREQERRLITLFALTPAQARVVIAVGRAQGLNAAARSAGIALSTTKTHLIQASQKMGISSQGEIIKMLQAISTL